MNLFSKALSVAVILTVSVQSQAMGPALRAAARMVSIVRPAARSVVSSVVRPAAQRSFAAAASASKAMPAFAKFGAFGLASGLMIAAGARPAQAAPDKKPRVVGWTYDQNEPGSRLQPRYASSSHPQAKTDSSDVANQEVILGGRSALVVIAEHKAAEAQIRKNRNTLESKIAECKRLGENAERLKASGVSPFSTIIAYFTGSRLRIELEMGQLREDLKQAQARFDKCQVELIREASALN